MPNYESDPSAMQENMDALMANPYPGRGIVLGITEDSQQAVQVYWVMGRSDNSRNRVLVEDETGNVMTEAFDPSKVEDPSLIIYNALRTARLANGMDVHLVSNGDQTDDMYHAIDGARDELQMHGAFARSLARRSYEPDAPNYTPRISALSLVGTDLLPANNGGTILHTTILRKSSGEKQQRTGGGRVAGLPAGAGVCFHTYEGDGDPLPSFGDSPYPVPVEGNDAQEAAEAFWNILDTENRVALVAKTIDRRTGEVALHIINQLSGEAEG